MELTMDRQAKVRTGSGLRKLFRSIEAFRGLNSEMPMQTASIFLMIAMKPGVHQRDLPDLLGLSQASISRNLRVLGKVNRQGKPGLDLVEQRIGSLGGKTPELHLTPAGKVMARRLMSS